MNENLISKKIEEVMNTYPLEVYPNAFGVYKEDDMTVAYIYQKEDGKWYNNLNDENCCGINVIEHIYKVLSKGIQPSYISDYVHDLCWTETERALEDLDDVYIGQYYHGRKLDFEYCESQGIDVYYMKQLSDSDIYTAKNKLNKYDKLLSSDIKEKLNQCASIEPTTLRNYEYLLYEPYYEDIEIRYTLMDKNHEMISAYSYDSDCHVMIRPSEYSKIFDLSDWRFNLESDLFEPLESGSQIKFMTMDTHIGIMVELNEVDKTEYEPNVQKGIKKSLQYCKRTHLENIVPEDFKESVQNVKKSMMLLPKRKKRMMLVNVKGGEHGS